MAAGPAKPNDGPLRDPGTPGAVGDTDQAAMPLSPTQFASEYLRSLSEATPFLGHGTRGGADAAAMAPFPHGADGSVNIADLASLGLGMGVNFESLDFLHGMEANAAGGSIDGQLRSFRHGSANLGAESIGGSTGGGGSQSGEAATIVDWNSLNLDQQLLLLQQPDFLMAFQNAMASSGAAASAQKVDGVVGPAPEATPGQRDSGRRRHRSVTSAKPGDYVSGGRPAEGSEDLGRSADGPSGAAADDLETTESPPRQPGSKGKRRAGAAEATPGGSSKPSPQRGRGIKSGSAVPDSGVILDEKIEDDRTVRFSPLVSPAMTPSLDFQRMSLAMAYGDGAALSPLSSPALRPTVGDSLDSSTRSPGFGPTRVSVTAKRGPGDGENVASTNFQGLPPPTATTPPYQVPLSGRRRTAKSGGAAQSGGSPALGPAKTSPPSVVRTSSLEQLPEKGQPPSNPALSPPFVFQALSPNDVLSPGSAGAFLPQLYAVPSAASPASMGAVAAGAGSKSDSPLMLAAKGGPVQIQALPPPIMGPPATPASMMNMGRPAQLPPHFVQAPSPASAMLNMGPYRLDMQAGPRFLTPPLGPTDVGLQFQLTDANTPIELRRSSHKVAEQKRRDSLRQCFDNLRDLLPQDQVRDEKNPSKVFILKKSSEYIRTLLAKQRETEDSVRRLREEVDELKSHLRRGGRQELYDRPLYDEYRSRGSGHPADRDRGEEREGRREGDALMEDRMAQDEREFREWEEYRRWRRNREEREREERRQRHGEWDDRDYEARSVRSLGGGSHGRPSPQFGPTPAGLEPPPRFPTPLDAARAASASSVAADKGDAEADEDMDDSEEERDS